MGCQGTRLLDPQRFGRCALCEPLLSPLRRFLQCFGHSPKHCPVLNRALAGPSLLLPLTPARTLLLALRNMHAWTASITLVGFQRLLAAPR